LRGPVSSPVSSWFNFNPLSLSPTIWLDASDSSTITASGSPLKVSQWDDKSGNGYHVSQGTAAAQPTSGAATQNGLNMLTFDGNDFMSNATLSATFLPVTLFVVFKPRINKSQALFSTSLAGGLEFRGNASGVLQVLSAASALLTASTGTIAAGSATSVVVTQSATTFAYHIDGIPAGSGSGSYSLFGSGKMEIGSFVNGAGEFLDGDLCEMIRYDAVLSSTNRANVAAYLRNKWGTP
jgi:hypothetical protein